MSAINHEPSTMNGIPFSSGDGFLNLEFLFAKVKPATSAFRYLSHYSLFLVVVKAD
jgi:hypothetical protein